MTVAVHCEMVLDHDSVEQVPKPLLTAPSVSVDCGETAVRPGGPEAIENTLGIGIAVATGKAPEVAETTSVN
jgi:hypothetical protein